VCPILHDFSGTDGAEPSGGSLIFDTTGNLYGTTGGGGTNSVGAVFELAPVAHGAWRERVLYSFNNTGTDGFNPNGGLLFDASGNLYGTTADGGVYGAGTAFEIIH